MRLFSFCFFHLCMVLLISIGCQPQNEVPLPSPQQASYTYYFNGSVSASPIDINREDLSVLLVSEQNAQTKEMVRTFHIYEDAEALYQWAEEHQIPLRRNHAIGQHLAEYAETSGAIREAQQTGTSPKWYEDYAKEYIRRMTGASYASRAPGTIFKDFYGGGTWSYATHMSFMPPGWNNRTSAYQHYGVYSLTTFYDRSFFRNKMFDHWEYGLKKVRFEGPLAPINDRTSSLLSPA